MNNVLTSTIIKEIIEAKLQTEANLKNVFGLDLTKCSIKKQKKSLSIISD
jgi:hypothetical protein